MILDIRNFIKGDSITVSLVVMEVILYEVLVLHPLTLVCLYVFVLFFYFYRIFFISKLNKLVNVPD